MESPQGFTEEINFNDLEIVQIVGKGAFGVVSKARLRDKVVAVKLIETESERKAFLTELKQLSRVSHPNIVKLYGASTKPPVCLVMEYAEGGSLYNVLHGTNGEQADYTAGHAMSWLLQSAKGVEYLHNMKPKALIHRDLKPPNLLLIMGGTVLKICDFGTACDAQTHMTNNKGSAAWMAPEVFEGSNYSEKCDVFSWGIIMWEVLTRRKPFDEIGGPAFRIMWAVHCGTRPPLIKDLPRPLELLMTRCWSSNAAERLSMSEVVRIMSRMAEFFRGGDEPLKYLNGSGNTDIYGQLSSNMVSWTQPSNVQTPGATIRETVRNVVGDSVPILPMMPAHHHGFTPPVVLDDDFRPKGGMSAPPSLAASDEDLVGRSPRSGTPVNSVKRHSTDLSSLDELDVTQNSAHELKPPVKGHRRSGSYGTPGMYTPVNQFLAPPTPNRKPPGKYHVRTGSDESRKLSFNSSSPITTTVSPTPIKYKAPISAPTKPMPHVYTYPGSLNVGGDQAPGPTGGVKEPVTGFAWNPAVPMGVLQPETGSGDTPGNSADIYAMKMVSLSLDHQLQPLAPAPNNEESMEIFRHHCQLAEDYLKVQTEIALLMQRKHELIKDLQKDKKRDEMSPGQIRLEYFELKKENDSLTTLHHNLKKQVDKIRREQQRHKIAA